MKRSHFLSGTILSFVFFSLFLQGCAVNFVVRPSEEVNPYPNAWRVETRVRAQINRVSLALRQGKITQDTADILAENDALIRRIMREDQGPENAKVDLDGNQTALLLSLLNDNDRTIEDALQRNQQWADYFQTGSYNYQNSDPVIYVVFLDYRLRQQEVGLDSALEAGSFTPAQGKEIRNRINVIREMKRGYFRANGRFDLTEAQVRQLSRMIEDNDRFLKYRLRKGREKWDGEKFNTWKNQKPAGWNENGGGDWGKRGGLIQQKPKDNLEPRREARFNTPTPVPAAPAPTWTPRPLAPVFTPTQPPVRVEEPAFTPAPRTEPPTPTASVLKSWQKPEATKVTESENSNEGNGRHTDKFSGPNQNRNKSNREGRGRGKGLDKNSVKESETPEVSNEDKNPKGEEGDKKDSVDSDQQDSKASVGDSSDDNSSEDRGNGKRGKKVFEKGSNRKDRNDN